MKRHYNQIRTLLILPINIKTESEDAKKRAASRFKSNIPFMVLRHLVKLAVSDYDNQWPELVTWDMLRTAADDSEYQVKDVDLRQFANDWLVDAHGGYRLSHEFLVSCYMSCPGRTIALGAEHVDLFYPIPLRVLLRDEYRVLDEDMINFLVETSKLATSEQGKLLQREILLERLEEVCSGLGLHLEKCLTFAEDLKFVSVRNACANCTNLVLAAYLVGPAD